MIKINEDEMITNIWDVLACGYRVGKEIDPWPNAQGITEQLYAQMMGWTE